MSLFIQFGNDLISLRSAGKLFQSMLHFKFYNPLFFNSKYRICVEIFFISCIIMVNFFICIKVINYVQLSCINCRYTG